MLQEEGGEGSINGRVWENRPTEVRVDVLNLQWW